LLLAATDLQHSRHHVQQHRASGVNVCLDDIPTSAEQTRALVELAHPYGHAGNCPERGREHRAIAQAIAFGQRERVTTTFPGVRERDTG